MTDALTPELAIAFQDHVKRWQKHPDQFAAEQFSVPGEPFVPDPAQLELFAAVASPAPEHQRIAMQAAAGTAKTAGMAIVTLWFMICWGDIYWPPCGAAVSKSDENLQGNYVKELALWRARSPLCTKLLDLNTSRLALRGLEDRGHILFRSYRQGADETAIGDALSGLHGPYVLQVIDEAGNQSPAIGRKTEQARTSSSVFCKVLAGGNPESNEALLHEIVTNLRHQWHVIVITGDPDDPNRSPRVPIDKARQAIATYGRDNAWVRIFILGQFPLTALNKFLGPEDIQRAQKRNHKPQAYQWSQNRLGVDPARFGDDRTGIVRRQGVMMWDSQHVRGYDSGEIAAVVAVMHMKTPFDLVVIDMGGENSGGVFDALNKARLPVHGVYSASTKVPDPRFYNRRSYMNWHAAEWVKNQGQLPLDAALAREAMCSVYDYKSGKLIVEDKDDIKTRLGESPDLWDAACLTFALPDAPKGVEMRADHPMARAVEDINPHQAVVATEPPWASLLR